MKQVLQIFLKVEQQLLEWDTVFDELRQKLHYAQRQMTKQTNGPRHEVTFEVGDLAYLKITPTRMKTLATSINEKLSRIFMVVTRSLTRLVPWPIAYNCMIQPTSILSSMFLSFVKQLDLNKLFP